MAELHLRVTIGDATGEVTRDVPRDVVVAVEATHTVAELAAALSAHLGVAKSGLCRAGRRLEPSSFVGRTGLVCGDVVELVDPSTPDPPFDSPTPSAVDLRPGDLRAVDVVSGPWSGRSFLLGVPGRYVVGRDVDVPVCIDDPTVSRRHAVLEIDRSGRTTVEPCPATANGVVVDGTEIVGSTPIDATAVVALGASRIVVRPVPASGLGSTHQFGRIDVHRTPYRPPVVHERAADPVGPIPDRPEPRRLQPIAVVAPLAVGVAMFAITRQVHFLALTLLSPMMIVGSALDDRRSGRRAARARVVEFRAALVVWRRRFERLRGDECVERFRSAPDLADLIRRAEVRTIDLWARGRDSPDVLSVRLGLGPDAVRFPIELERGGADDLRAEAVAALEGLDRIDDVPVTVDLVDDAVFAVHGPDSIVDGVVASIVVQAAVLHSPDDLVVVGALARRVGWLHWLPHSRSVTSPLPGDHLARTSDAAGSLVERLIDVAVRRRTAREPGWPRLLVVLEAGFAPDAARVAQLLELAPAAGISVVWVASTAAEVPRHATRTLEVWSSPTGAMRGRSWSTDPEVADRVVEVEHLRPELADRVARALAPLRDASTASLASSIPRTVALLDVLGVGRPSAAWVTEHWLHRPASGLRFPIGVGADGVVELDLVEDGPHALVGGTSGSGKSELLQAMIAGLVVHHPPTRLNVLFVDYKGGATARPFRRLPHTVGSVTNLSPELANRALVSLRAELHRRMALLDGRAKDLDELVAIAPDDAPASLVIVVDEFATLVREIPEFVTGIVDIAQRGRSLGIHLVLATQRPTGSVNDNILANTNLRIALRLLDRAESTAVVGAPDAADLPVPLRGRGFVRLGPRRLVEIQVAHPGAPVVAEAVRRPVLVAPFEATDDSPTAPAGATGRTQLDVVLDAVVDADRRLGLPTAHRPWCDVLADVIVLDDVLDAVLDEVAASPGPSDVVPGRTIPFGLLDVPERQEQRPAVVDLEDGGGLLVYGSGGAGATTLLRTIAVSVGALSSTVAPVGAVVVAFDGAGRALADLVALPHVAAVVPGDDLEALTRHLSSLDAEVARRGRLLAGAGAEHLTAYARHHPEPPPRIVVLIDGIGGLTRTLLDAVGGRVDDEWVERIVRLVVDGRRVGVHCVVTADRRSAVPTRIQAAVAHRLVLRHADEASALDHGVVPERVRGFVPGRGLLHGSVLVQVASVSADPSVRSQRDALVEWARRCGPDRRATPTLTTSPLPDRIAPGDVHPDDGDAIAIGVADVTGRTVSVDLDGSNLTVCGPPRSGRSTALAALIGGLAETVRRSGDVVVVGPATSPLRRARWPLVTSAFGADVVPLLERLVGLGEASERRFVVVDDADTLDDPVLATIAARLMNDDSVRFVVSLEARSMSGFTANPLVGAARRARRLLVLQPDDPAEVLQISGVRVSLRPGVSMPPGRGVLLVDRTPTLLQVVDALGSVRQRGAVSRS